MSVMFLPYSVVCGLTSRSGGTRISFRSLQFIENIMDTLDTCPKENKNNDLWGDKSLDKF